MMHLFNNLPPSIEPFATGHIIEQIQMVQEILDNGFGYEVNGSVYFDTEKFIRTEKYYGQLSGRVVEDLITASRDNLKNQDEKRNPADFAIWIKAGDAHFTMAFTLVGRLPGMAPGVLRDEHQISGQAIRHSRGRCRSEVSASRK